MAGDATSSQKGKLSAKAAFGAALRDARMALGMSQDELSARSGYQRAYISQIERGLNSPTLEMVFAVCGVLEVKPSVLLRRTEKASGFDE